MGIKIYLILILYSILSQGIRTLSNETIDDLHIRRKRLIDRTPNGNRPVEIENVPYIVSVQNNEEHYCGGSILSPKVIITAGHCLNKPGVYTVLSGSAKRNRGIRHIVIHAQLHPHSNMFLYMHDLTLLVISPPIDVQNSPNRDIHLYDEYPSPNTLATFSGWGCVFEERGGRLVYPDELRSITVSTIGLEECHEIVIRKIPNHIQITAKDICTGELNGIKGSCHGDSGGPLVIDGKLAGVFSFSHSRTSFSNRENPDIFVNVAHPLHKFWINSYVEQFSSPVHV